MVSSLAIFSTASNRHGFLEIIEQIRRASFTTSLSSG
jgi:hypothetical protein